MASGSVHDRAVGNVFTVMNEDSPEIDEAKEEDVGQLLERENERENMVWHTLRPAVQGVESVRGERAWHDPLVVRLVQSSVYSGVVQAAVDPVDEEIGKADEKGKLQNAVVRERFLGDGIVEFGISADLQNKERCSQQCHGRHGGHGLFDFEGNLVSKELGMVESRLVPDEDV